MWLGEFVRWWHLVNVVIMWIDVYVHCGFLWWLGIFELGSNCMSYLLVLIHLVNIFDDNHSNNSNEVKFVHIWIYILHSLCWLWLMWSLPPMVLTAYLFVWMGRRSAGVVCLVSAWIAEAISIIVFSWLIE